jgi:hypothetical protein
MSEAMKCLCNIIFNSSHAQVLSSKSNSVEGVVMRLQTYKDPELPYEVKFFSVKILFLITALCEEVKPQLKSELLMYLTDTLDLILKEVGGEEHGEKGGTTSSDMKITLSVSVLLTFIFMSYFQAKFQIGGVALLKMCVHKESSSCYLHFGIAD